MRPRIAQTIPLENWVLFEKIRRVVLALPDLFEGPAFLLGIELPFDVAVSQFTPSCHVLARALAKYFPVDVHDGSIYEKRIGKTHTHTHEHSWLIRSNSDGWVIIDPQPLGFVTGPALYVQDYAFNFGHECCYIAHRSMEFLSQIEIVAEAIGTILEAGASEAATV